MVPQKHCPARPQDWGMRGNPSGGNVGSEDLLVVESLACSARPSLLPLPVSSLPTQHAFVPPFRVQRRIRPSSLQRTNRNLSSIALRPCSSRIQLKPLLLALQTSMRTCLRLPVLNWAILGERQQRRTLMTTQTMTRYKHKS